MLATNGLKHRVTFWLCVGLMLMWSNTYAEPEITERIEWNKTPIRLDLKVGHERLVHLPGPVQVGVPAVLQPALRIQNVDGTLYFLANAPFDATRVMVRTLDGGPIYLFDLLASKEGGQTRPVQVFVKAARETEPGQTDSHADDPDTPPRYGYVALTRFAAQQLYAPARLLQERPGIVRVPVAQEPVALLRGGAVEAAPLVTWRAGGLYVTAVKLTNRTDRPQTLDPRDLRGTWMAATFQHHRLSAAGGDADTTAVYLISARPFESSR